jgi:hypothetical protein
MGRHADGGSHHRPTMTTITDQHCERAHHWLPKPVVGTLHFAHPPKFSSAVPACRVPDLRAAVGALIDEVDLRHAPMRCNVLDVHRRTYTAWAGHEGWFGVVMADIGWQRRLSNKAFRLSSPTTEPAYFSTAAINVFFGEHRRNGRALPGVCDKCATARASNEP